MRRSIILATASAAAVLGAVLPVPAHAAPGKLPVVIVAHTTFGPAPSEFESTVPGCESGTVVDGAGGPHFTPGGGHYAGIKEFTCTGGAAGFDIRLTARFGPTGSIGSWTVADAWGDLDGMKGSGSLVAIPISATQLDDIYTGTVR